MKVLLVAHGYPPEIVGGTENSVQALARGLASREVEVVVVAGSMQYEEGFRTSEAVDEDPITGAGIRVRRIHRDDLFFDHWQKSLSTRVSERFREILREERPDLVHVHHWIRLSRDLVACAAREGIPAIVTLHDLWTTCLLSFRVPYHTQEFCEEPLAHDPCLECAGRMPPLTPWMDRAALVEVFDARRADLVRELEQARAVIVPTRSHAENVERFLGLDTDRLALRVVPHGRDLDLRPGEAPPAPGEDGRLVLAAWGHLHPLKGADLVLEAIARLPAPERVALHLAGGEVQEAYTARLREMAAGLDVRFHGPFEERELSAHPVAAAHAMVSGTRALESWGLVVDEAVALRLPMVLPRAGAFPERVTRGALFYEPRDPDSLAAALRRLLEEPELVDRLRRELPAVEELVPSVASHVDRVLAVYREIADGDVPPAPPEDPARAESLRAAEREWDRALSSRTAEELGFE